MATLSGMLRSLRILLLVVIAAALVVAALPSAALAQGAGDDQYADPFGDMPVDDGGGGNTRDTGGDPSAEAPSEEAPAPVESTPAQVEIEVADTPGTDTAQAGEELPRTGLPAGMLALTGLGLLALGTLIHFSLLRFAPASGYARAWRMQPLHQAPRPPGFAPLNAPRRFRRRR